MIEPKESGPKRNVSSPGRNKKRAAEQLMMKGELKLLGS